MRKVVEANERLKRDYLGYLRDAEGYDEATLDKVAASILTFEEALGFKPFKAFHREWAARFKAHLRERKNHRTGKPLGVSTRDGILRDVKSFFHWLASQKGFKSRVTYPDVRYFNNNAKDARAAHAQRPKRYPTLAQCAHAFRLMPETTVIDRRNRAMFALWVMTGARAGALASFRVQHVDLVENVVNQDGREVRTKAAKSFETWFLPVDPMYREAFEAWFTELTEKHLYGPGDALFPKRRVGVAKGLFTVTGLSPEPYANAQIVGKVIGSAFREAGLHVFNPHSIRTTLAQLGDSICPTMEARKAWAQNLGHDSLATTVSAYLPVSRERQAELIRSLAS